MAYAACSIKNVSGGVLNLYSYSFPVGGVFEIPDAQREGWAHADQVIQAVAGGSISDQLDLLRGEAPQTVSLKGFTDRTGNDFFKKGMRGVTTPETVSRLPPRTSC